MAAQLLQNPNSLEKASGIITRQGAHVSRLVDDLLDASRVTSGRIELTRKPLNLANLVSECVGSMRATGQFDRHAVEIDLEAVWVDGDSDRLAQVVTNLLGNAIKYTPSGGKIGVRVKKVGEEGMIQVQDDGAGIPSEILPRVFDLFVRGEFGLHRSPAGLGIGLTLVSRIAGLHGGRVEVPVMVPAAAASSRLPSHALPLPTRRSPIAMQILVRNWSSRAEFCSSKTTMTRDSFSARCLRLQATRYTKPATDSRAWKRRLK
jgi:K+-sensing histidine kinase KdpD